MHRFLPTLCLLLFAGNIATAAPKHALVLFGKPKYAAGFHHFDYVNPDAPKGGRVKLAQTSNFDSLNPFILKGLAAPGTNYMFETLMTPSLDEPQSYYGLIAEKAELSRDKSKLTFYLNENAKWHDGTPITADDVVFSFNTLKEKGHPTYRLQYAEVGAVEKLGPRLVRFHFTNTEQRELPILIASMPIISKAYYTEFPFDKSSLKTPMASGPYTVKKLQAGRFIAYERVENYWAKNLPVNRGKYNFDTIRYDVYRDDVIALEAFKSNDFDLNEEYIARNWAMGYNFPAFNRGDVIKYSAKHKIPRGMQAFMFNMRRGKFADRRVREAIGLSLDFEWMNRTLFYDAYQRNISFFQNTPFAATEPPSAEEQALLEPYKDILPPGIMGSVYLPPQTDGSGFPRAQLIRAQTLLDEAGWLLKDGKRVHKDTGEVLTVEFLIRQKTLQRVIGSMKRNLKKLGIITEERFVDDAQYQKRLEHMDFDLISIWWNMGLIYPGQEQLQYWHSMQADIPGSQNYSGLKNPAVDHILSRLVNADTLESLTTASRALDRTLMWEQVVIPHWSITNYRVAYWNKFDRPKRQPEYGLGFETWWLKKEYR